MIAASDGAGRGTSRTDTRGGADKSADNSPFSILLAATSQPASPQPASPQSAPSQAMPAVALPAANDDVILAANDAVTPTDIALATAQPATNALGDNAVPPESSRHDKKADGGKDPDGGDLATTQQAQPPAQAAQVPFDPTVVQPVPQVAVQTPVIADGDDGIDAANPVSSGIAMPPQNNGGPATQAPSTNKNPVGSQSVGDGSADPRTSSQLTPVGDSTDPVPQNPAPIQVSPTAGDDGTDVANGSSSNGTVTGKDNGPAVRNKIGDGKPAANNSIGNKTAGKQPIDPNAASQIMPAMDDDAEPAAQNGIGAPPPVNSTDQTALATGGDARALARMANGAQVPVQGPADKDTVQVDKPAQAASNAATGPQPIATPVPQDPATTRDGKSQLPGDNPIQAAASVNTDGKPVHVSDATPQPDAPLPVVHAATPANGPPQGLMTINPSGTNIPDGAANTMVTASVHIAAAGANAAPDTNALAVTIAARSLSGAKQFEIRLDPPELGRVEVRLSIDASGKTQAHMTADQPQTLDLLRKDAPALTQALRDAGLDVSQSGLNFSLRGQDRQAGDRNNGASQGRRTNLAATRAINAAQGTAAISFNGAAADARVDIHV